MDLLGPGVEDYLRDFLPPLDDPVVREMEALAEERGFPAVGRLVGTALEILARAVRARRVFELGSGFGYSAYWFSRAVGPDGEVHLTDRDPENERLAHDFLGRAGLSGPIRFHLGDALQAFAAEAGEFDIVFCDIDKADYPRAWDMARDRVRVGGLYICDNALIAGSSVNVITMQSERPGLAEAVRAHNDAVRADPDYLATILPVREGDLVALRIR